MSAIRVNLKTYRCTSSKFARFFTDKIDNQYITIQLHCEEPCENISSVYHLPTGKSTMDRLPRSRRKLVTIPQQASSKETEKLASVA